MTNDTSTAPADGAPTSLHGDLSDVITAGVVGVLIYGVLLWICVAYQEGNERITLLLACALGAAFGWVIGILASPYTIQEKDTFSTLSKLIYGFISGYVVSKVDKLLNSLLSPPIQERPIVFAGIMITSFLTAVAVTYVSRTYWITKAAGRAAK